MGETAALINDGVLQGHLKISVRDDVSENRKRLLSRDLKYELDGVDIGSRLKYLRFEINGMCVVDAEMTLCLTDIEIDAPLLEILTHLKKKDGEAATDVVAWSASND